MQQSNNSGIRPNTRPRAKNYNSSINASNGFNMSLGNLRGIPKSQLPVTKQQVRQMIQSVVAEDMEEKYLVTTTNDTLSTAPVLHDLALVPQGVGDSNRVGDTLTQVLLEMRVILQRPLSTAACVFRISIIQWMPATVPSAAALFFGGGTNLLVPWYKDTSQQFRVLYDRIVPSQDSDSLIDGNVVIVNELKLSSDMQFQSGSTSGTNHIYLVVSATGSLAAKCFGGFTLRYLDG